MRLAHSEGPLVQPLVREEVIILECADLQPKNKPFLLRPALEVAQDRRRKHEGARGVEFASSRPTPSMAFRWSRDSISFRPKFGSNPRSAVLKAHDGTR